MKVFQEIKDGPETVLCPECREPNPVEDDVCFNCDAELLKPAPLWRNAIDVMIRPVPGMRRVAATMPYIQGMFLYLGLIFLFFLFQAISLLSYGQSVVDGKNTLSRTEVNYVLANRAGEIPLKDVQQTALRSSTDPKLKLTDAQEAELKDLDDQRIKLNNDQFIFLRDNTNADIKLTAEQVDFTTPKPDQVYNIRSDVVVQFFLQAFIQIAFTGIFAVALQLVARLFFKDQAKVNFKSLYAISLFAQLNQVLLLVLSLVPIFVTSLLPLLYDSGVRRDDATNLYLVMLQFVPFLYQLFLLVIGVRFSTTLSWNKSLAVVLIPAVLLRFILKVPF